MKSQTMHVGIDVSKEKLDIYNPETKTVTTEPNTVEGFRKIRTMARKMQAVVCCEPTGGLELDLILFLQKFGVPVAYCDGYRVRHYALATGQFSKNDKIDAELISRYADNADIRILDKKTQGQIELRNRWSHYQTFVDIHTIMARKASSEHDPAVRASFLHESARYRSKARNMLKLCIKLIEEDERKKRLYECYTAIDGIGPTTAIAVIANVPELGSISDAEIAKLVGVAPMDHQSGKVNQTKHIYGGRKEVRNALYMAAVASVKHNHILGDYYMRLKSRMPGPKASKWALVPVMRKIIELMNRIARNPNFVPAANPRTKAA